MSKLKTPHQKKTASYENDRRGEAPENPHRARKALPRTKARLTRANRHAVHQALHVDGSPAVAVDGEDVDQEVGALRRKRVTKVPPLPLRDWIEGRKAARDTRARRNAVKRSAGAKPRKKA